ncbi:hypothetical protein R1sor_012963 [Riccia sorocarpa]|uniref:Urea active transporter n=1 Tax=Riccia sorocarpa TaxID=122646 RepID=A0ABD3I816_9MARC
MAADSVRKLRCTVENRRGSYLTMFSNGGLQFGVFNIFSVFGQMFADQSYWQGAIAATPRSAYRGYILGGLLWFSIPFTFSTAFGLGVIATDLPVSKDEYGAGLICVAAAQFFMGRAGVVLILTMVFMSVTSSGSSEIMAMSSLFTYDIYKTYFRPNATSQEILAVSRLSVCGFGLLVGGFSCFCLKVGVDVNFLFFVAGLLVSSASVPIASMIMWKDVPATAAIASALGGQIIAVIVWLTHTWLAYQRFTAKDTLQRLGPSLSGTCAGLGASIIILVVWTRIAPTNEDYLEKFDKIELMDGVVIPENSLKEGEMHPLFNRYTYFAFGLSVVLIIIWPLLTLPAGIFSEGYFTFWVILAGIWSMIATIIAIGLPLVEARGTIISIIKNMFGLKVPVPTNGTAKPHTEL